MAWLPLREAVYGSEQPIPSNVPVPGFWHVQQRLCAKASNACLSQLWPICSKRVAPFTVEYRYKLPPMTGCVFAGAAFHMSVALPILHDVVPSDSASSVPLAV